MNIYMKEDDGLILINPKEMKTKRFIVLTKDKIFKTLIFSLMFVTGMFIAKSVKNIYFADTYTSGKAVYIEEGKVCVPIIMYHQVKNKDFGKDVISPSEFESDLKYLRDNNYNTITMEHMLAYVYEGAELPENPVILSFDDGYYSTYKYVYPLLQEYNMKIVLAIIGKSTDDYSKVDDTNIDHAHLRWEHIKEMSDSGLVEIQNHSYNLHKSSGKRYGSSQIKGESIEDYTSVLSEDITSLQSKIEEELGRKPTTYAYPYGKYNNNTDEILKENGIQATLSVKFGVNLLSRDNPDKLFGLKRICRAHNEGIGKLIKDGMETLRFSSE